VPDFVYELLYSNDNYEGYQDDQADCRQGGYRAYHIPENPLTEAHAAPGSVGVLSWSASLSTKVISLAGITPGGSRRTKSSRSSRHRGQTSGP
jgi:hypothetical protein